MGREKALYVVYLIGSMYVVTREDIEKEIGASLEEIASLGRFGLRAHELEVLYRTADEVTPKVLVEIGGCHGLSSVVLGAVARKYGGKLYSIEYKDWSDWRPNLCRYGVEQYVVHVKELSPYLDWSTISFGRVSYLLVDGDHHFFPVAADFRMHAPSVRKGGRIAFHEYNNRSTASGVREVVDKAEKLFQFKRVAVTSGGPGLIVLEKLTNLPTRR